MDLTTLAQLGEFVGGVIRATPFDPEVAARWERFLSGEVPEAEVKPGPAGP